MNYFNEEEEEEEEEEEGNSFLFNKNKEINRRKGSSLKQKNPSININNSINDDNEEEIKEKINEDNNNNYISYLGNNSSRPETPKLNTINKEDEKIIENKNNDINIDENIFSETLQTKFKDINSNDELIILNNNKNNNENLILNENLNIRQTFHKIKNIDENKNNCDNENIKTDLFSNNNNFENNNKLYPENDIKNILDSSIENNKIIEKEDNKDNIEITTENNNNINNIIKNKYYNYNTEKYSDQIKRKKLLLELKKTKEQLKKLENSENNNNSNENSNLILNNNIKENNSINNSNNINFINFKEIKEIYKDDINNNINKKVINKNNNNKKLNPINANNIDELFFSVKYNDINKFTEKNSEKKKIINHQKKELIKSKSMDSFNKKKEKIKHNKISYNLLSSYNDKLISKIIGKNKINKDQISIIGIIKSLQDLKIIQILNDININTFKEKIENIYQKLINKQKEIELIEQIWFILNPNNKEYINTEIFESFIKLIFPYSIKLNQNTIKYIKEYIQIINFMEPKNNINNIEGYYYSPLRNNKIISQNEIWPIEKIVKIFLELKRNSIAYKKNIINNDINKNKYINNNTINNIKKKKPNYNFDKLYDSFIIKQKIREKTLNIMREVQEKEKEEKLSKYTYIPKICKNNKKILNDSIISNNDSVYDNLYKRRNDKNKAIEKVKKKIKEENEKEKKEENYLFKPKINKIDNYNKIFEKNSIPKNCKNYIKKNLDLINKKKEEKLKEEKKFRGDNYEEAKKIKFDCKGPLYKNKKEIEKEKEEECTKNKKKEEKNFSVEIRLPNEKILNISINLNEDIKKKVENLSKIYSLNESIKEKLINQIEAYKDSFQTNSNFDSDY